MTESSDTPLLEMIDISKSFGGVQALRGVDFSLRAGEIHGLVGENGAGKSTLMKIIAGVHHDFQGTMKLDGKPVRFRSARDALDAGVGMVHQELSIVPDLTVAENVFLGTQPKTRLGTIDWRRMVRESREHLAGLGIHVDPTTIIGELPIGLQQLIELARVLFSGARIIILDEPTSALSPPEVELLFTTLRRLRDSGRSMVFISHFLDDILSISDTVTIFRNGQKVITSPVAEIDKRQVIEQMIGIGHRELEESYTGEITLDTQFDAPVIMETRGLSHERTFQDVSMQVRAGEVLGIYGFMGCGQIELARALFGKIRAQGVLTLDGKPIKLTRTSIARQEGIAYVPESRRSMLFHHEPLYKNMSISILERISRMLLKPSSEREIARGHIDNLRIRTPGPDQLLGNLSGGNQQKVALAKWLTHAPKVLILSEPTRGMDVGAKEDVVRIVRGLRDKGIAVIVVSTEPETVLSLADRILVMKKGEIVREFAGDTVSKDRLLEAA
ncbi:sugar ABC transporter ATP-binding protein [Bauldia sp.]|uniref:sugar ABC transporter ATP-binding protein n=1 Tax=Bauldia sp. TaxID=2575872 RepID=UPI0025B82BDD|nr:sugar ABC transporter ATP-binding protein [Bauldia sp.]